MAETDPKKPLSKIKKIPLSIRKQIFSLSLLVIMLIIFIFWVWSFNFKPTEQNIEKENSQLQELSQQLQDIAGQTKQAVDEFSAQFNALVQLASTTPSSTPETQNADTQNQATTTVEAQQAASASNNTQTD